MAVAETAELAVKLSLRDGLSAPLGKASQSVSRFGKSADIMRQGFSNAARNIQQAAVVGVGLLTSQIGLGIRSLGELQRVQAQTNAVITSTGGVAGITADEVRKLSNELEDLTTIDDKAIQSAQNLLLTFTNIGRKEFPAATLAALNMATALGEDLNTAAMRIGIALNDPIGGVGRLRKAGVQLNEQQIKSIKTFMKQNQIAKAQAIILKELNTQLGGSAQKQAQTFEGRMRRVGDAIEEAQMALATAFLPVLEDAAGQLGDRFISR